jgi:hypothetical protein
MFLQSIVTIHFTQTQERTCRPRRGRAEGSQEGDRRASRAKENPHEQQKKEISQGRDGIVGRRRSNFVDAFIMNILIHLYTVETDSTLLAGENEVYSSHGGIKKL